MIKDELYKQELFISLQTVLGDDEFHIVELSEHVHHATCNIRIVIQAVGRNTTIDDCTRVHRLLFPRLELLRERKDVYLEVSTPGLQRTIKDVHEFSAFIGKEVQVLMKDSVDWFSGTLFKVKDNSSIIILSDGEEKEISFDDLNKVKLVYNWEDSK